DLSLSTNGASLARPSAAPTASASFSIEPYFDLISLPTSWRRMSFLFDAASRRAFTVSLSSSDLVIEPRTVMTRSTSFSLLSCSSFCRASGDFFVAMVVSLLLPNLLARRHGHSAAHRAAEALEQALDPIDEVVDLLLVVTDRQMKGRALAVDLDPIEVLGEAHHHELRALLHVGELRRGLRRQILGVRLGAGVDVDLRAHARREVDRPEDVLHRRRRRQARIVLERVARRLRHDAGAPQRVGGLGALEQRRQLGVGLGALALVGGEIDDLAHPLLAADDGGLGVEEGGPRFGLLVVGVELLAVVLGDGDVAAVLLGLLLGALDELGLVELAADDGRELLLVTAVLRERHEDRVDLLERIERALLRELVDVLLGLRI